MSQEADEQPEERHDPVTVTIHGPPNARPDLLGQLLAAILTDSSIVVEAAGDGRVRVHGYVQADVDEFLEHNTRRIAELEELVRDDELALKRLHGLEAALRQELEVERAVTAALEARLSLVGARSLALAVAHGDIPPDQFEARRKIDVNGVRDFVGAVRTQLQPRQMRATDGAAAERAARLD